MKKFKFKGSVTFLYSVKVQMLIFYLLLCIIVLAIGSFFSYSYVLDVVKKQNERYLLKELSQSVYNIESLIKDVDRLSNLFINEDNVQKFLTTNEFSQDYENTQVRINILNRITDFINYYSFINSIYFLTDKRGELGSSKKYGFFSAQENNDSKVFTSNAYKSISTNYPKKLWDGNFNEIDFNPMIKYDNTENKILISQFKRVFPTQESSPATTLIFNIDEAYFATLYAAPQSSYGSDNYIVNDTGIIISSSNATQIGSKSKLFSRINYEKDFGSYITNYSGKDIQQVFYRIKDTNWIIVSEVPLNLFSRDIFGIQYMIEIVFITSLIIIFLVSLIMLKRMLNPLDKLASKMNDVSSGNLGLTISKIPRNEIGVVIRTFNEMSLSIVELINNNAKIQKEKRKLEIVTLQAQINPHFLYNTLNMIKWMGAIIKAENIVNSIVALNNILKPIFRDTGTSFKISEELEYLKNYIQIMNWRFGNGIHYYYDIPENIMDYRIPRFCLQPIVENSIVHAMKRPENTIDIHIEHIETENELQLIISDTGVSVTNEKVTEINQLLESTVPIDNDQTSSNIGITNVNRRIKLTFGLEYGLRIDKTKTGGLMVIIVMPNRES